ncbi:MAG: S8 family serine peptidase, partial [Ignavibacteriae bacterium]|nr:S8 family serine peptidase [Ignavibacteriota bacterium]
MNFRTFFFTFLVFSVSFGQTKIFIKYKDQLSIQESKRLLTEVIQKVSLNKTSGNSDQQIKQKSFLEDFGPLNSDLDRFVSITIPKDIDPNSFIQNLANNSNIESVSKSVTYKICNAPTDSLYLEQWGLQSINAPEAWDLIPQNPKEIILAVIDTGIDYEHPDLKNVIYINSGEIGTDEFGQDKSTNEIDDDGNGFVDDFRGWDFVNKLNIFPAELQDDFTDWDNNPFDENGHGTQISGIIGAEHNNIGIAGVNPNIKLLNIRGFDKNGSGEEDDIASAILYAVKMGAKVINMSFGDEIYSEVLKDVIQYAYSKGVVLVGSSGNSASDLPHYPSGFNEVISVGSIQENDALSSFSNFGSTIDLVAPGSLIMTTSLDNTYKEVNGTSASTPFVSGTAAILLSIKDDISNEEVKQVLKSTSIDLGDEGWDIKYGAGKLNLLKAIELLVPSEIKINAPIQDYYVTDDNLDIIITVLAPSFQNFTLYFGIGYNPTDWQNLEIDTGNEQVLNKIISSLDVSNLADTVYTVRLLVDLINGTTVEERTNFHIDRTTPEVLFATLFPALLNGKETFQASIATDDLTTAKLYFRQANSDQMFDFIYLDGLATVSRFTKKTHYGFIPLDKIETNNEYEFYFEVTNRAELKTTQRAEDGNNYVLSNVLSINPKPIENKSYTLPLGRIFHAPISIGNFREPFILLNENETSANLSIFKKDQQKFTKVDSINNRIPVSVGDFNNDGKTDILSLFVKNGFIETQTELNKIEFTNVFSDSSGNFWPAYADDIDGDNKTEIIAFSSDTTITIWEVQNDFILIEEKVLVNFLPKVSPSVTKSIFRTNKVLVDDFNNDSINEILTTDNFGRIITFNITGQNQYEDGTVTEHFYPFESKSNIAKGDFNSDGIIDVAIFLEFENDEYFTPLNYCSVISLNNNTVTIHFQNMFLDVSSEFYSVFQKKYKSIDLANIDDDENDELIIFNSPNSYVFNYNENSNTELLDFRSDVNTQTIFVGDIDGNSLVEIGIPNLEGLGFVEFNNNKVAPPVFTDFYSKDSTIIYLEWMQSFNPVHIYSGSHPDSLRLLDSTASNYFNAEQTYFSTSYYSIIFYDPLTSDKLSNFSETISVFAHAPTKIDSINIFDSKNIELVYS